MWLKNVELKCGITGGVDLSLVGLLARCERDHHASGEGEWLENIRAGMAVDEMFRSLEDNRIQLAVVGLEHLADHVRSFPRTSVRILGQLVSGDCRAMVSLAPTRFNASRRRLGASHPGAARARWEDISCAHDLECCHDETELVPQTKLTNALLQGQHNLLELNLFWEGLVGFRRGLIRSFARAADFGIPESCSHVLLSNERTVHEKGTLLAELRQVLMQTYQALLADTEQFVLKQCPLKLFDLRPNCPFLLASARILGPHVEEFIRTGGRLELPRVNSYLRWLGSRAPDADKSSEKSMLASTLESILCDAWS